MLNKVYKNLKKNKGFTLGELLIVVAIIAVLVAISVPVFNSQLEKSRRAVDEANARNIYAVFKTSYIDGTIDFSKTNHLAGEPCIAVVVHKDKAPDYRASGKLLVNGLNYPSDPNYSRVKKLLSSIGNVQVKAKSTDDDGWSSYCVVLFEDGTCRVISSKTDINIGNSSSGDFESKLKKLADSNPVGSNPLESSLGNIN